MGEGVLKVMKFPELKNQDLRKNLCVSSGSKTQKEKIYWNFWDFSVALGDNRKKNGMKLGLSWKIQALWLLNIVWASNQRG